MYWIQVYLYRLTVAGFLFVVFLNLVTLMDPMAFCCWYITYASYAILGTCVMQICYREFRNKIPDLNNLLYKERCKGLASVFSQA